jgi:hypothetical protein
MARRLLMKYLHTMKFKLHYNTVLPQVLKMLVPLMQAKELEDFRLVGGTALSLQIGH